VEVTLSTVLLGAAVIAFVVAAFGRWGPAIAVGLACFAGAFLVRAF
jgi:hypothetical protein